jgi:hypothetical protein
VQKEGETMIAAAQEIIELVFMIAYTGGFLFWFARLWIVQREYFLCYGIDITQFNYVGRSFPTRFSLLLTQQSDPYVEALRLKIKRRVWQMAAWIFLFPLPFILVLSVLPYLGNVR